MYIYGINLDLSEGCSLSVVGTEKSSIHQTPYHAHINNNNKNNCIHISYNTTVITWILTFVYHHRPDDQVINGITLDLPEGCIVGVVGASGAGKSTIIKLMERFYDVGSGKQRTKDVCELYFNY